MKELLEMAAASNIELVESDFGVLKSELVKKYTWKTSSGFSVSVISYGAIIQSILLPDKNGVIADVALGFDTLQNYLTMNTPDLLGGVVGRCVGRIANGTFTIDGEDYHLTRNCGHHHLHGANEFDRVNWKSTVDGNKVIFSYLSADGNNGFPGDLLSSVCYEVKSDDTLHIEYTAVTSKTTVVNLSNHSYFNLAGHHTGSEGLYQHTVVINSDKYLEGDSEWVPTGEFLNVGGSPFDLRTPKYLGDVISTDETSIRFHHNFVVNRRGVQGLGFVARVEHPNSGRFMEVHSDQPGVIFYTAHYIKSPGHPTMIGKGGVIYNQNGGLCLETMNLVDAIHHDNFPSSLLKPGEVYKHNTVFSFGAAST